MVRSGSQLLKEMLSKIKNIPASEATEITSKAIAQNTNTHVNRTIETYKERPTEANHSIAEKSQIEPVKNTSTASNLSVIQQVKSENTSAPT
jgi:hypothetical protein